MMFGIIFSFFTLATLGFCHGSSIQGKEDQQSRTIFYKPLNFQLATLSPAVVATNTTNSTLTPFDIVSLDLINAFRTTHTVPRVTYDTALAAVATACAEAHARANSATTPVCACNGGGETVGFNPNSIATQRARGVISDPTQLSWFAEYTNAQGTGASLTWPNPTYDVSYSNFTQMIWRSSTTVGCGTSTSTAPSLPDPLVLGPQYMMVCCWSPAGNTVSQFVDNVLEDTV